MSCCSCGARGLLCFPPAVEFSLGGLRALLRHGNQPKEETNAGGKQRREREDKSRSWVCFLFLELVVFSLMKWNGMKKNKREERESKQRSPQQEPQRRLSAGRGPIIHKEEEDGSGGLFFWWVMGRRPSAQLNSIADSSTRSPPFHHLCSINQMLQRQRETREPFSNCLFLF